jgi:hypothetical protein
MPHLPAALNLSVADIQRLIQDRRRSLRKLERKRAELQRKVDRLDRQIAALGGTASRHGRSGGTGSRASNESSLADTIAQVLGQAGGPLGIADVTEKVLASGYRTNSGNFKSVVSLNLTKDKTRFENVGRGIYQLRNGTAGRGEAEAERPRKRRKKRVKTKAEKGGGDGGGVE